MFYAYINAERPISYSYIFDFLVSVCQTMISLLTKSAFKPSIEHTYYTYMLHAVFNIVMNGTKYTNIIAAGMTLNGNPMCISKYNESEQTARE